MVEFWFRKVQKAVLVGSFLSLACLAQTPVDPTPSNPGTVFHVSNDEYPNVTLTSSVPVDLDLKASPNIIMIGLARSDDYTQTELALSGLKPETDYYKYSDASETGVHFVSDANGTYSFTQTLDRSLVILIKPRPSTIYLPPLSAHDSSVGTWDGATRTFTLTQDVHEPIILHRSGYFTLDGNGKTVSVPGNVGLATNYYPSNIVIKNLTVTGCDVGVIFSGVERSKITNCRFVNNNYGVYWYSSRRSAIVDNEFSNNSQMGFYLFKECFEDTIARNAFFKNQYGIWMDAFTLCQILSNRIDSSSGAGIFLRGGAVRIHGNIIKDNTLGAHLLPYEIQEITGNDFITNRISQAICWGGGKFRENFWSQHASPDLDGDGYVDTPLILPAPPGYSYPAVIDSFPLARPVGPEITDIEAGPFYVGKPASISATIQTYPPNTANVAFGEFRIDSGEWFPMSATDGEFDEVFEEIVADAGVFASAGSHAICMRGHDSEGRLGLDTCVMFSVLANQPPTANAGADQTVFAGTQSSAIVTLDGSSSFDPDSDPLSYAWSGSFGTASGPQPQVLVPGGIHTVTLTVSDPSGATSTDEVVITVIVAERTTVTYTGSPIVPFPNALELRAHVVLENGASADLSKALVLFVVTQTDGAGTTREIGSYTISCGAAGTVDSTIGLAAGVYSITMTVVGNYFVSNPEVVIVPVYDPTGGFATGGGFINVTNPDEGNLGRANFGFVAKYKDGSSAGNIEFQYKDGDIDLKSLSIDWLVVSNVNAQFQGTAIIKGRAGQFTFRVNCTDNLGTPNPDKFTIRIWEGSNTDADPIYKALNQDLAGGNILVKPR